jgi:hypothetical protein
MAAPLGQAATQAPPPMHTAAALDLTLRELDELGDLRAREQHRGGVGAGGHAGAAADAGGRVERQVGALLGHRQRVRVDGAAGGRGDEAAGGDDAVERAAVDDQVAHDREGLRAPWLDRQDVAVLEAAHVQLAGRHLVDRAMRAAVDHHAA